MNYQGRHTLITGGCGAIGSNLAIRLVELGAHVTVVDSLVEGCGGSLENLESIAGRFEMVERDLADAAQFREVLHRCETVFNLAGEMSHVHSMTNPERDLRINATAQLRFLTECPPGVRVVYAGTRQVYGVPDYLPADEEHAIHPVDFNGIHKYAATMYHQLLSSMGRIDAIVLRLTNVYGPRMALHLPAQGFLGVFLRRARTGETIEVFGDGGQLRDPLFADDAVDAFLLAGAASRPAHRTYNVGGPEVLSLTQIAEIIRAQAGGPPIVYRPFPAERKAIDIGSYYTDSTRIMAEWGWKPAVRFAQGVARTLTLR